MRPARKTISVAEKKVQKLEQEITKKKAELKRLRRKVPLKAIADHELLTSDGKKVLLSSLFQGRKELLLIHNMGTSCAFCTLWADGFNGVLAHIEDRVAFVVESPDRPQTQRQFAASRRWKFEMVSSLGSSFREETGFQDKDGSPIPGVSVFILKGKGKVFQVSKSVFGPGDNYCNVWDLFDLLPSGREWWPRFRYS